MEDQIRYNNAVSQATQDIHELILRGSNDKESLDILKSHLFIISDEFAGTCNMQRA